MRQPNRCPSSAVQGVQPARARATLQHDLYLLLLSREYIRDERVPGNLPRGPSRGRRKRDTKDEYEQDSRRQEERPVRYHQGLTRKRREGTRREKLLRKGNQCHRHGPRRVTPVGAFTWCGGMRWQEGVGFLHCLFWVDTGVGHGIAVVGGMFLVLKALLLSLDACTTVGIGGVSPPF